jgi:hypothetical protein
MTTRRIFVCLLATIALLTPAALPAGAQRESAAETECIKGTVAGVETGALHLKKASFPDETLGKRDATVLLDKATTYYDGTKKVSRASLQTGHLVLVFCRMAGKDRVAVLVRIIGGKKL